jgi:prefoldin subunit 5
MSSEEKEYEPRDKVYKRFTVRRELYNQIFAPLMAKYQSVFGKNAASWTNLVMDMYKAWDYIKSLNTDAQQLGVGTPKHDFDLEPAYSLVKTSIDLYKKLHEVAKGLGTSVESLPNLVQRLSKILSQHPVEEVEKAVALFDRLRGAAGSVGMGVDEFVEAVLDGFARLRRVESSTGRRVEELADIVMRIPVDRAEKALRLLDTVERFAGSVEPEKFVLMLVERSRRLAELEKVPGLDRLVEIGSKVSVERVEKALEVLKDVEGVAERVNKNVDEFIKECESSVQAVERLRKVLSSRGSSHQLTQQRI